jgi:hypothetical protein
MKWRQEAEKLQAEVQDLAAKVRMRSIRTYGEMTATEKIHYLEHLILTLAQMDEQSMTNAIRHHLKMEALIALHTEEIMRLRAAASPMTSDSLNTTKHRADKQSPSQDTP